MKQTAPRFFINYVTFGGLAICLNFLWEYAHVRFYVCPEPHTMPHLLWFAFKDALWYLVIAITVMKINRQSWRYLTAGALGLVVAGLTEYHALTTGRWSYTAAMPTITAWHLGLSPLLQMSLGLIITLWLSQFLVRHYRPTYTCPACGFSYAEKILAEQCETWCRQHHSCNIDIIKHALPQNK